MIYTYLLNRGGRGVRSPGDALTLALNLWQPQWDYVDQCLWATAGSREVGKVLETHENCLISWKSKDRYMLTSRLNSWAGGTV